MLILALGLRDENGMVKEENLQLSTLVLCAASLLERTLEDKLAVLFAKFQILSKARHEPLTAEQE